MGFSLRWIERNRDFLTVILLLFIFLLAILVILTIILLVAPVSGSGELTANREFSKTSAAPGDTFRVVVTITANGEVISPALDENLPKNWVLNSVDKGGAILKESTAEWIWAVELVAGESKTVVYDVTVPVNASYGSYFIKGNVSAFNVTLNPVQGNSELIVSESGIPMEKSISLYPGWNFISVPYTLKNESVDQVLEGVDYEVILYYNAGNALWEEPLIIEPLKAYWIRINGTEEQIISSDKLTRTPAAGPMLPPILNVYKGWNSIGYTDSSSILCAELALKSIDGVYTYILGPWDPVNETYEYTGHNGESGIISGKHVGTNVFEMDPYEGYWVYVTEDELLAAVGG